MEATYPWVGINYKDSIFGKRLLILGESYYCDDHDDCGGCPPVRDILCNYRFIHIIIKIILDKEKNGFYTKLHHLITDKDKYTTEQFWNNICFTNYVLQSVASQSRIRPINEMWKGSGEAFVETLKLFEPDKLLILGEELWKHLPGTTDKEWEDDMAYEKEKCHSFYCNLTNKRIHSLVIDHPQSFGFDYSCKAVVRSFVWE